MAFDMAPTVTMVEIFDSAFLQRYFALLIEAVDVSVFGKLNVAACILHKRPALFSWSRRPAAR